MGRRRRIPPLRTELDYAPTEQDRLELLLGGFECEDDSGCSLVVCHEDRHHTVFDGHGEEPLSEVETLLSHHPDFIVSSVCRYKHSRVHRTWDRSDPICDELGVDILTASPLNLGANDRDRLKVIRAELDM